MWLETDTTRPRRKRGGVSTRREERERERERESYGEARYDVATTAGRIPTGKFVSFGRRSQEVTWGPARSKGATESALVCILQQMSTVAERSAGQSKLCAVESLSADTCQIPFC